MTDNKQKERLQEAVDWLMRAIDECAVTNRATALWYARAFAAQVMVETGWKK